MQLPTLTMTRDEALEQAQRFRRARRTGIAWTEEDQRMLMAYTAIARGRTVIDLHRAMALAGTLTKPYAMPVWRNRRRVVEQREAVLPVLAIARADRHFAWTAGVDRAGSLHLRSQLAPHHANTRDLIDFPPGTYSRDDTRPLPRTSLDALRWRGDEAVAWRALLPPIPPPLRHLGSLARLLVLWEAEWEIDTTVPPGDPALLKHLGGTLYEVLAQWDLTPVEQAVLAGRQPLPTDLSFDGR